ncbi:MAG: hypothetical protein QXH66_02080 [Conexivisphaerales archaeon]
MPQPCLLNDFLYDLTMSYGFYTDFDGRGVDSEAPPSDYTKIVGHQIGRVQKLAFNKLHANADALLYNEAERLASKLGADAAWTTRVVQIAKKVKRGIPLLRVLVAAYVEGGHSAADIVRAGHVLDVNEKLVNVNEYTLFSLANHNKSLLRIFHRPPIVELYPLAKFPYVNLLLQSYGPNIYMRVSMWYKYYTQQEGEKMVGSAPRTIAVRALKLALEKNGIHIKVDEVA